MKKILIISLCLMIFVVICSQREYDVSNYQYMEENYTNGYFYKRYSSEFEEAKASGTEEEFMANLSSQCDAYIDSMYEAIFGENGINRGELYSRGLSVDTTGFFIRSIVPNSSNAYYFSDENISFKYGFYGECVWYATGRAQEIIDTLGINYDWTFAGDAHLFFDSVDASHFGRSVNPLAAKQGAILVFSGGKNHTHGHVMIVEKINTDNEGNITSINIGEGGQGITNKFRYVTNVDINIIANARNWSGYTFEGYVYLTEPIGLTMVDNINVADDSSLLSESDISTIKNSEVNYEA